METDRFMHGPKHSAFPTLALAASALMVMAACTVGPNYKRPAVQVPANYRGATAEEAAPATPTAAPPKQPGSPGSVSLGDEKWWEVFEDKELQQLISTALKNRRQYHECSQSGGRSDSRVPADPGRGHG